MKTIIATLIVSVATATSAFALDANQLGVPGSLNKDYKASAIQVSGFAGVAGGFDNAVDANQGGVPASLMRASHNAGTFGFTGVADDFESSLDANQDGIPASLR